MDSLSFMSAAEMAANIRSKKLSPVEVTKYFLERIEKRNPSLNAFVYTDVEKALARAKEIEADIMAGKPVGLFAGVPTAAKDFIPGLPGWKGSFGGIKALSHLEDTHYTTYTKSLIEQGAVFLGKTNSPSLAFRGTCDNYMYGPTSTPFKVGYNSGGSSGGSCAAVADGMLPIAEGSDGGGSIRIPAAWCGIYGFKPALGTVSNSPRPNGYGTSHPYCFNGAQSRTVEDTALAIQAMAGYDPFDPFSLDYGDRNYLAALKGSVKGWRIAYTPDFGIFPVDPEIREMVGKAAKRFEEAGATVEPIEFNLKHGHLELAEAWCRLISISGGMESLDDIKRETGIDIMKDHRGDIAPEMIYWIEDACKRNYRDYCADDVIRTEIFDALQTVFQTYDLILSPVTACHPVKNNPGRGPGQETFGPRELNGEEVEPHIGWCLTYFTNFTGHPAASVPAGISKDGFPVGMQLIGKRFGDLDVLTASAEFERIQPWAKTYEIPANRVL
ncbi:MAG: amidase [Clostridiales bacterium]|nr:amidase [Clostridiales bacterium]